MLNEPRFEIVKLDGRAELIPDYMKDLTLAAIKAYYFNWHPHAESATLEQMKEWYKEARGWDWEQV